MSQPAALIGDSGSIYQFEVTDEVVRTFQNMSWTIAPKYASHTRHMQEALLEATGLEAETVQLPILLLGGTGVSPLDEITQLLQAARGYEVLRLMIGTHAYGTNRWVITGMSNKFTNIAADGTIINASVTLTLKSYAYR